MDQIPLSLDREGVKEREDGESGRVGGGAIIRGGDYFKIFPSKGAIIRGTAIIRGNTLVTRHN